MQHASRGRHVGGYGFYMGWCEVCVLLSLKRLTCRLRSSMSRGEMHDVSLLAGYCLLYDGFQRPVEQDSYGI